MSIPKQDSTQHHAHIIIYTAHPSSPQTTTFPTFTHSSLAIPSILSTAHPLTTSFFLSQLACGSISRPNLTELSSTHVRSSGIVTGVLDTPFSSSVSVFAATISWRQLKHDGRDRHADWQEEGDDGACWRRVRLVCGVGEREERSIGGMVGIAGGWVDEGEGEVKVYKAAKLSHPLRGVAEM